MAESFSAEVLSAVARAARAHGVEIDRGCFPALRPRSLEEIEAEEQRLQEELAGPDPAERVRLLMARGIPKPAAEAIVGGLAPTDALRAASAWQKSSRCVLVLSGPKDSCKTTAASWLVARWPWWGTDSIPLLVPFDFLLGAWYATGPVPDETTGLRRADLLATALLVLDDVGQEPGELVGRYAEAFDLILRRRCDLGRPTVITTNELTQDALLLRYSPERAEGKITGRAARIAERLTEHGQWARCPVEGFRGKQRRAGVLAARKGEMR